MLPTKVFSPSSIISQTLFDFIERSSMGDSVFQRRSPISDSLHFPSSITSSDETKRFYIGQITEQIEAIDAESESGKLSSHKDVDDMDEEELEEILEYSKGPDDISSLEHEDDHTDLIPMGSPYDPDKWVRRRLNISKFFKNVSKIPLIGLPFGLLSKLIEPSTSSTSGAFLPTVFKGIRDLIGYNIALTLESILSICPSFDIEKFVEITAPQMLMSVMRDYYDGNIDGFKALTNIKVQRMLLVGLKDRLTYGVSLKALSLGLVKPPTISDASLTDGNSGKKFTQRITLKIPLSQFYYSYGGDAAAAAIELGADEKVAKNADLSYGSKNFVGEYHYIVSFDLLDVDSEGNLKWVISNLQAPMLDPKTKPTQPF
ncbi:hypothetical protein ADUPG1_008866 [Aduncisulcus paluster]|uniref:Uncharacterized protein n=1 Tax=Aduncisulcus paluster TaxID=2918883 RepID=A0ABQ5KTH9_9EUKA|nr:hypothetical protein ADUPG1_008866 [Aduncisulcus paluster]